MKLSSKILFVIIVMMIPMIILLFIFKDFARAGVMYLILFTIFGLFTLFVDIVYLFIKNLFK